MKQPVTQGQRRALKPWTNKSHCPFPSRLVWLWSFVENGSLLQLWTLWKISKRLAGRRGWASRWVTCPQDSRSILGSRAFALWVSLPLLERASASGLCFYLCLLFPSKAGRTSRWTTRIRSPGPAIASVTFSASVSYPAFFVPQNLAYPLLLKCGCL